MSASTKDRINERMWETLTELESPPEASTEAQPGCEQSQIVANLAHLAHLAILAHLAHLAHLANLAHRPPFLPRESDSRLASMYGTSRPRRIWWRERLIPRRRWNPGNWRLRCQGWSPRFDQPCHQKGNQVKATDILIKEKKAIWWYWSWAGIRDVCEQITPSRFKIGDFFFQCFLFSILFRNLYKRNVDGHKSSCYKKRGPLTEIIVPLSSCQLGEKLIVARRPGNFHPNWPRNCEKIQETKLHQKYDFWTIALKSVKTIELSLSLFHSLGQ